MCCYFDLPATNFHLNQNSHCVSEELVETQTGRIQLSDSSSHLNDDGGCKKVSVEKDVHSVVSTSKQVIVLPFQNLTKNVTDKVAQVRLVL